MKKVGKAMFLLALPMALVGSYLHDVYGKVWSETGIVLYIAAGVYCFIGLVCHQEVR